MTCRISAALMKPLPSLSKALKASINSSSVSVSFDLRAINDRNSGKSMVPFPSASTSLIISCNSADVGFWPKERMTVPSCLVGMVPSLTVLVRGIGTSAAVDLISDGPGTLWEQFTATNDVYLLTSCKAVPMATAFASASARSRDAEPGGNCKSTSFIKRRPTAACSRRPAGNALTGTSTLADRPADPWKCKHRFPASPEITFSASALLRRAQIWMRSPRHGTPGAPSAAKTAGAISCVATPCHPLPVRTGTLEPRSARCSCRITFGSKRSSPATYSASPPPAWARPSTS
mmetsp:Transcript_55552/g.162356  ORF Transcript_55552/g.162356 Transcript_55552/m.162356 type:complete len:290 (-) Transcript_55552:1444-2313(-)